MSINDVVICARDTLAVFEDFQNVCVNELMKWFVFETVQ